MYFGDLRGVENPIIQNLVKETAVVAVVNGLRLIEMPRLGQHRLKPVQSTFVTDII